MKIAVNTISTKKQSGGAYQIAYNFLLETLKHQDEIEWWYITSTDVDELVGKKFEAMRDLKYFVFPTQPDFMGTYVRVMEELSQWEKQHKPDVIYTISSPCYFTFKTPEVMRFANAWVTNPNKYAWASMSWKEWLRMRLYRLNQVRMLKKASYMVTQSETVKRGLLRITGLSDDKVQVVSNVLPQVFATAEVRHKEKNEWVDVMCVAAPVPHKNLDIIPKVLRMLKEEHKIDNVRFHLTIPEDNSLFKKIIAECEVIGLKNRIVNHGRCSQQQLCNIYNTGDLCLLPTLLETFSASSLEAMYFGLPIVATDFEFNKEVIQDSGLYYKPMDAADAATQLARLIQDEKLAVSLQKKMAARIVKYNDYGKHFEATKDFLVAVGNNIHID